jgi:hypothetical protein
LHAEINQRKDKMTDKQLRDIVFATIQEVLLAEISALRQDMRELRQCSRESLEQIRAMRLEFRQNLEHLNRQLERLAKMVEEKLSGEDADQLFPGLNDLASENNWKASAGSGTPTFDRDLSSTEIQARMQQMEHRLRMIEKALQRN